MCDVMYSASIFSHLFFMIFSKNFTLPTRSIHVYLHIPMCLKDFVVFPDILSLPLLSVQIFHTVIFSISFIYALSLSTSPFSQKDPKTAKCAAISCLYPLILLSCSMI